MNHYNNTNTNLSYLPLTFNTVTACPHITTYLNTITDAAKFSSIDSNGGVGAFVSAGGRSPRSLVVGMPPLSEILTLALNTPYLFPMSEKTLRKHFKRLAAENWLMDSTDDCHAILLRWNLTQDGFIALMPTALWLRFYEEFLRSVVGSDSRKYDAYTKLYCYIYFNICKYFNDHLSFFHSINKFQENLKMDTTDLSARLKLLEEEGWITRGSFNAEIGLARTYGFGEKTVDELKRLNYNIYVR